MGGLKSLGRGRDSVRGSRRRISGVIKIPGRERRKLWSRVFGSVLCVDDAKTVSTGKAEFSCERGSSVSLS